NAEWSNVAFAIFAGTAGTVTVDNGQGQVQAQGMQFASDGYILQGQPLELVGPPATARVGDGTRFFGSTITATIDATLTGTSQLVKIDEGTLLLTAANSYSGGTAINGGTLQIASDANLGDLAGTLSLDGGTLRTTANISSARAVTLNAGGGT